MNQRPVLDDLFQALLTQDQAAIHAIQENRATDCLDIRAVVCTNQRGAVPLDLSLNLDSNCYTTPLFEGPRAFFMSRHTSIQARLTGGKATVPIDYSLSFDSNFAERLRAVMNGRNVQAADRERVISVLMLKANNDRVQFDVMPCLYENIRLARENAENARPLETLIAFRMLDHLDWASFRNNSNQLEFGMPPEALKEMLRHEAEVFLTSLYTNPSVLRHEAGSLGIQALLLRMATLWHKNPNRRDIKRLLGDLLEFCFARLGYLPVTELSLIWSGIKNKEATAAFFDPITKPAAPQKMFDRIRGMAWDMTHLRIMEQAATQSVLGSFFIPYFVSIDARWRDLLRLNPVSLMLIDDSRKSALFARAHDLEFHTVCNEVASATLQSERTPGKIESRRIAARSIDANAMRQLISQEEQAWLQRKEV
ncbi:hypothetical protein J4H89_23235 (plasmid) [Ralstonia solanacearum]|nr:hypothetical protein J4H89_23235 [Ralstonia solanacearum]